ncbi:unnamed protein product, partial [Rotaria sordida]
NTSSRPTNKREPVNIDTTKLIINTEPACFENESSNGSSTSIKPCSGNAFIKRSRIRF